MSSSGISVAANKTHPTATTTFGIRHFSRRTSVRRLDQTYAQSRRPAA
jgi:hypothetical protein